MPTKLDIVECFHCAIVGVDFQDAIIGVIRCTVDAIESSKSGNTNNTVLRIMESSRNMHINLSNYAII